MESVDFNMMKTSKIGLVGVSIDFLLTPLI